MNKEKLRKIKEKIKEILTCNADDVDVLSDNHTQSFRFYSGTLEACIDEIFELFKSIEETEEKCTCPPDDQIGETKLWCCNVCGKKPQDF